MYYLENSSLHSIFALREAWTYMDVTGLARPSVDEPGEILPGALEMHESPTAVAGAVFQVGSNLPVF